MNHTTKIYKAIELYDGFTGPATIDAIFKGIPDELVERLTAKELSMVMQAVSNAYYRGKESTGAEMVDDNAVFVAGIGKTIEWGRWKDVEKDLTARTVNENTIIPYFCEQK